MSAGSAPSPQIDAARRFLVLGMGWLLCSAGLVAILLHFRPPLHDADSTLYDAIARGLAERPLHEWISPTWPADRAKEGLFLEHFPVFFWLPAWLYRAGIPSAALIANLIYFLVSLVLLFALATSLHSRAAGWLAVFSYVLSPVALQYLFRANHETAWAMAFLGTLLCAVRLHESWPWKLGLTLCVTLGVAIKGLLAIVILPLLVVWSFRDPRLGRPLGWYFLAGLAALTFLIGFEFCFRSLRGVPFFLNYLRIQSEYVQLAEQQGAWKKLFNFPYYFSCALWFGAPGAGLVCAGRISLRLRRSLDRERCQAALLTVGGGWLAGLSLMTRRAVRYIFPVFALCELAGAAVLLAGFPRLQLKLDHWADRLPWILMAVLLAVSLLKALPLVPYDFVQLVP